MIQQQHQLLRKRNKIKVLMELLMGRRVTSRYLSQAMEVRLRSTDGLKL